MGIINSLLSQDLYTFTVWQCAFHQFSNVDVEYAFKCRNEGIDLLSCKDDIENEIYHFCEQTFEDYEIDYLRTISFLKKDFLDYLENFRPRGKYVKVYEKDGQLAISIKGSWLNTIIFEVPILAIVNEVYFRRKIYKKDELVKNIENTGRKILKDKIDFVKNHELSRYFKFADFGLRRRFNSSWQNELVETLVKELPGNFIGTSNVLLASRYNIKPIGTMSHQFIQVGQGLVSLQDSQKYMLDAWVKEYRGDLGIALSDTLGFDAFLKDMDLYNCKLYDGCRQDSGNPFDWCNKLIEHYKKLRIDPMTKTAVFSDGLTFPKALDLVKEFKDKIKLSFGIGTNLTNDVGFTPLNIVIKLVKVNNRPVAKLSDSPGKGMCEDKEYLTYLKKVFKIED